MKMPKFVPQEKRFFEMMEKEAENLYSASKIFADMFDSSSGMEEKLSIINKMEHEGDVIVHDIFDDLNKTFITPIDREDIAAIASEMDNVLDLIDEVAEEAVLFKIESPNSHLVRFSKKLRDAVGEIHLAVKKMRNLKNAIEIKRHCIRINELEHEMDIATINAYAQLFESADAIKILKLKELYTNLEDAMDNCEDVADVIMGLLIKYA